MLRGNLRVKFRLDHLPLVSSGLLFGSHGSLRVHALRPWNLFCSIWVIRMYWMLRWILLKFDWLIELHCVCSGDLHAEFLLLLLRQRSCRLLPTFNRRIMLL